MKQSYGNYILNYIPITNDTIGTRAELALHLIMEHVNFGFNWNSALPKKQKTKKSRGDFYLRQITWPKKVILSQS